jgi:hypothetical protein
VHTFEEEDSKGGIPSPLLSAITVGETKIKIRQARASGPTYLWPGSQCCPPDEGAETIATVFRNSAFRRRKRVSRAHIRGGKAEKRNTVAVTRR